MNSSLRNPGPLSVTNHSSKPKRARRLRRVVIVNFAVVLGTGTISTHFVFASTTIYSQWSSTGLALSIWILSLDFSGMSPGNCDEGGAAAFS